VLIAREGAKGKPQNTGHAEDRLAERGISKEDVVKAVEHPQHVGQADSGNTTHIIDSRNGILIVIVAPASNPPRVVTVLYTSKKKDINKYWPGHAK